MVWGRDFCIIDAWNYYFHSTHLFSLYSSLNDFGVSMLHILLIFFSFLSHYSFPIYLKLFTSIFFYHILSSLTFYLSIFFLLHTYFSLIIIFTFPFISHSYLHLILHHYWWLIHLKSVHDLMANLPTLWGFEPMSNHFALIIFVMWISILVCLF